MGDLRWALLLLGTVFLAGLGLWEWRRGSRRPPSSAPRPRGAAVAVDNETAPLHPEQHGEAHPEATPYETGGLRREPVIGDISPTLGAVPAMDLSIEGLPVRAPLRVGVAAGAAVDLPRGTPPQAQETPPGPQGGVETPVIDLAAPLDFPLEPEPPPAPARVEDTQVTTDVAPGPPPIRWPPANLPDRVLGLRVAAPPGQPMSGQQVRLALQAAGLRHGPRQIFHRTDDDGNVLASVANLLRPGSLLPERMDGQEFRGLSLFTVLPGPQPDAELLDGLVLLARALAARLGAAVQDEYGQDLDAERLAQLRQAIASSGSGGGDAE